ncbi:acyl-CoA thioesterase domain-containing protein [Microbacterium pygmaeum]|uniref:Thioesterase-like superfamily protein n=1 Tax=Microbacterium pygmaeum TaxID=370764 RepID=A0A1G7XAQ9_9MICO|nr:acyl-CoA thioesterase domain-containing protein [Microbacterium pygmaeum]SDG81276.1 Thioesterase-like superfamily protein [Microbacterium pygmaeum]
MSDPAFFDLDEDGGEGGLIPRDRALSSWSADQLRGPAVAGALARATETAVAAAGMSGLHPTRFTLDLFRPVRASRATLTTSVVRRGTRLVLIDADYRVSGESVARSSTLLLAPSSTARGTVWSANRRFAVPAEDTKSRDSDGRLFFSEATGWSESISTPDGTQPNQSWHAGMPIVTGEQLTPFQMAASVADISNLVSNWGTCPLAYINADVTMALTRLPEQLACGLATTDRLEHDGIAVGSLVMYDRRGPFGTTTVSALANERRAVNPVERSRTARVRPPTAQ